MAKLIRPEDTRVSTGTGTNATATATASAVTGRRHQFARIHASYSAAFIGALTIKKGTDTLDVVYVNNSAHFDYSAYGDPGGAISAELAAGGVGVVGRVTIEYWTP